MSVTDEMQAGDDPVPDTKIPKVRDEESAAGNYIADTDMDVDDVISIPDIAPVAASKDMEVDQEEGSSKVSKPILSLS